MEKHNSTLDTGLRELIAAAGNLAFECSDNGREAYKLARVALIEFIKKSAHPFDSDMDFETLPDASDRLQ